MPAIQPARFFTDLGHFRPGVVKVVKVNQPAVGADWTIAVPAGNMWKVASGQALLVTGATVATRVPQIQLTVQGVAVGVYPGTETDVASTSSIMSFTQANGSGSSVAGANNCVVRLPELALSQGDTIGSLTAAIQGTDQWSNIALWVEEFWFTNSQLSEIEARRELEQREVLEYELAHMATGQER